MNDRLKELVRTQIPLFSERLVYTADPRNPKETLRLEKDFKAIADNEGTVAVPSSKYALVQIRDTFLRVLDALGEREVEGEVYYRRGTAVMHVFPRDGEVGLSVRNSTDTTCALAASFVARRGNLRLWLPVKGYRRIHVGTEERVQLEVDKILGELAEKSAYWRTIVNNLSSKAVTDEDIQVLREVLEPTDIEKVQGQEREAVARRKERARSLGIGKRLARELVEWAVVEQQRRKEQGGVLDVWSLILKALELAASEYAKARNPTDFGLQEKFRRLSVALLSYALD